MKPFHKVLFATDFTEASEPALTEAIAMARGDGTELLIAHVYQPPRMVEAQAVVGGVYEEWDKSLRDRVEEKLKPLLERVKAEGIDAKSLVLSGNPYEAIIDAARENDADLVVMGTHGRTGVSRLFLGSVASRVIASAPCPVLTVHAS